MLGQSRSFGCSLVLFGALVLTLLAGNKANAGSIGCTVDGNYSQVLITWNDSKVQVSVNNPMGFDYMPQFESPVSLSMVSQIQSQSKDLAALGDTFTYEWDKKKCSWGEKDKWLISCEGMSHSSGADNGVHALLMTTARIDESSLSSVQSTLRVRFIFDKNNMYFVALPFPMTKCSMFENDPIRAKSNQALPL